jgi:non-ribosomal peptide synthase protein (TIGR01720 family)
LRSTIERVANDFMEALRAIIEHCRLPEAGGYTPSDFPKKKFTQKELDSLIAEIERSAGA